MIEMKIEDIQLVRRAQNGDQHAFAELVRNYTRLVNVIVFHHTHRQEETRDLVQEGFLKALENLHQLDEADRFRSWLMQIARTTSRNKFCAAKLGCYKTRATPFPATQRRAGPEIREEAP